MWRDCFQNQALINTGQLKGHFNINVIIMELILGEFKWIWG